MNFALSLQSVPNVSVSLLALSALVFLNTVYFTLIRVRRRTTCCVSLYKLLYIHEIGLLTVSAETPMLWGAL